MGWMLHWVEWIGDSSFLHADLVARSTEPTSQFGVVVDIRVHVDLEVNDNGNDIELKTIPSHLVKMPHSFFPGKYVVSGNLLGIVDDVC
jgi:hypothetical protein